MSKLRINLIYFWRAVLYSAAALFLVWIFWQNLVPSGVVILKHVKLPKDDKSWYISNLHPLSRLVNLKEDGNNQRFFSDPVYFDVKAPREFKKVKVDISWQNKSQPILELGARKVRGDFGFVLKPLENKIIDNISWPCQREDGILFCQKVKRYSKLSDYLSGPSGRLLTYHYRPAEGVKHGIMNVESDINKYDYLISTYEPPQNLGNNWFKRTVEFEWQDFALYINQISFTISAPKLQEGHGQIVIGNLIVTLEREPLDWAGFVEYVKNQVRRLRK